MWSWSMLVTTAIVGVQVQERRVGLVGLGDEELAVAEPRVRARGRAGARRSRTSDRARLRRAPRRRGSSSSSCRACPRPRCPASSASARRASARAARPGCRCSRAAATSGLSSCDRARHDDDVGVARRAPASWPTSVRTPSVARRRVTALCGEVGARHLVALRREHLGDAAHADAADADEVHALAPCASCPRSRELQAGVGDAVGAHRAARRRAPRGHLAGASRGRARRGAPRAARHRQLVLRDRGAPRRVAPGSRRSRVCSSAIAPGSGTSSARQARRGELATR